MILWWCIIVLTPPLLGLAIPPHGWLCMQVVQNVSYTCTICLCSLELPLLNISHDIPPVIKTSFASLSHLKYPLITIRSPYQRIYHSLLKAPLFHISHDISPRTSISFVQNISQYISPYFKFFVWSITLEFPLFDISCDIYLRFLSMQYIHPVLLLSSCRVLLTRKLELFLYKIKTDLWGRFLYMLDVKNHDIVIRQCENSIFISGSCFQIQI